MFDLDKFKAGQKAVTRAGDEVTFIALALGARHDDEMLVALVDGEVRTYACDGRYDPRSGDRCLDLIAMKPRVAVLWVNRYTCGACAAYRSEMDADDGACEAALERIGGKARRIEIPMED